MLFRSIVFKQEPAAGTMVSAGTEVTLYVSRGRETVTLPDVRNKILATAEDLLRSSGFEPGSVSYENHDTVPEGQVIEQSLSPNMTYNRGTFVNMVVSLGVYSDEQPTETPEATAEPTETPTDAPTESPEPTAAPTNTPAPTTAPTEVPIIIDEPNTKTLVISLDDIINPDIIKDKEYVSVKIYKSDEDQPVNQNARVLLSQFPQLVPLTGTGKITYFITFDDVVAFPPKTINFDE